MKTTLFISCLFFFFTASPLVAQDSDLDAREKFTFGIKAGINYSNVWDEKGQDFNADPIVGFAGGLFFGVPIGMYLGFQPEVLVSQKGFTGTGTLLGSPYSFKRVTTYLDVPLLLQVKPASFITVLVGPQYSYLLNEKNEYTFGSNSVAQEQQFNNDNIRKNTLGFVAGLDINITHVVVSGRVGWDFQSNNGDGTSFTPRYKNQWLQFTLGFKL